MNDIVINTEPELFNMMTNNYLYLDLPDSTLKNIFRPKYHWGKSLWEFIHTITVIDFMDNDIYVKQTIEYLKNIINILPCKKCKIIYQKYIDKLNDININENMVLFKWSFELHNEINVELNQKEITYKEAINTWTTRLHQV